MRVLSATACTGVLASAIGLQLARCKAHRHISISTVVERLPILGHVPSSMHNREHNVCAMETRDSGRSRCLSTLC